jgi:hypothetical protein
MPSLVIVVIEQAFLELSKLFVVKGHIRLHWVHLALQHCTSSLAMVKTWASCRTGPSEVVATNAHLGQLHLRHLPVLIFAANDEMFDAQVPDGKW